MFFLGWEGLLLFSSKIRALRLFAPASLGAHISSPSPALWVDKGCYSDSVPPTFA